MSLILETSLTMVDIDKLVSIKGFVVRVSDIIPEMKAGNSIGYEYFTYHCCLKFRY
jgi:hypothetical protein